MARRSRRPNHAHFAVALRFGDRHRAGIVDLLAPARRALAGPASRDLPRGFPASVVVDIETEIEQFFRALTLHETVYLGTFAGSAGLPLAALLGLVPSNPRFGSAE